MDENTELTNIEQPSSLQRNSEISSQMDASGLVESMLSNSHIPKHLQKELWIFFSRTAKLTFLNPEDVDTLMLQAELIRLTILESIPKKEYNEELELELTQIMMEFKMTLERSVGGKNGMSERILLGSSTQMSFSDKPLIGGYREKSFLDKLGDLFSGRK